MDVKIFSSDFALELSTSVKQVLGTTLSELMTAAGWYSPVLLESTLLAVYLKTPWQRRAASRRSLVLAGFDQK